MYILVHFWQRVSVVPKHRFWFITSGIHAATENAQRISTAMDGGDSTQKRDLRNANLAGKKCTWRYIFYRASALFSAISLYLHRLFSKAVILFNASIITNVSSILSDAFASYRENNTPYNIPLVVTLSFSF